MGMRSQRLFHTIVVLGAGLGSGCAARSEPTERTPEPRGDVRGPDDLAAPPPQSESSSASADDNAGSCECDGEGAECSGNGVMCCWAQGDCCEPCCPDLV
jgi:hypothetical protein